MEEKTIIQLHQAQEAGTSSARKITEYFLERIDRLDRQGPALHAIIELNPDALSIAGKLDAERETMGMRGPLHGIPVLLKDNIDTADKMQTTSGSLALAGHIAEQDATVARMLRDAGAVILGKTNLSEWANFRSSRSTSGWSSRGGQTRNPYALDRNPCGSSAGSAVAVAADLCAGALGTETDGSIICPSHTNGIVGIKPTLGLISRAGIIPIAHSQDTAGPMARTVADAAILLGALVGEDQRDAMTATRGGQVLHDYTLFLKEDGLQGARIGVARNFFGFHDRVDAVMESCIAVLRMLGAQIVDPADIETSAQLGKTEFEVLLYEFKADLNLYLSQLAPDAHVRSLKDIIDFNEKHSELIMPHFGQERMLLAQEKGPLTETEYREALATNHRLAREEGIDATLRKHALDAIIAPSGGPACLIDWVLGDHHGGGSSSPAAVAGLSQYHCPGRLCPRTACRHIVLQHSIPGSQTYPVRLRV